MKHLKLFLMMCVACAATGLGHAQTIPSSEVQFRYYHFYASNHYLSGTPENGSVRFKIEQGNPTTFGIESIGAGRYLISMGSGYLFANVKEEWSTEYYGSGNSFGFDETNSYFDETISNRMELLTVNAVRQGDVLYALGDVQVDEHSNLEELAQSGTIKKIDLSQTNNFTFSFSNYATVEGKTAYMINPDSEMKIVVDDGNGYVRIAPLFDLTSVRHSFFIESDSAFDPEEADHSGQFGENIDWELKDGTLTVSGTGAMPELDVPTPWTHYRNSITGIVITDGITTVRTGVFFDYVNLASVTLPESLVSIGTTAFASSQLTSVTVNWTSAENLPAMGNNVFPLMSSGAVLHVPPGSESIYTGSEWNSYFSSITGLPHTWNCGPGGSESVTATLSSNGTLTISGTGYMDNFYPNTPWNSYRRDITAIVIEEGVRSIERYAFSNCSNLTSVTLPNSMESIGDGAFYQCVSLTSVTIPDGVISIGGEYVFWDCMLTDITVTDGNTTFSSENGVLYNKGKTVLIIYPRGKTGAYTLPTGVTSIEESALTRCPGLTGITVEEGNTFYSSEDGVLFNGDKSTLVVYPAGKTGDAYVIPNSVTGIERYAFCLSQNLTSVTLPQSVTNIGHFAFMACHYLTSFTSLAATPPPLSSDVFMSIGIASGGCTLTVPAGSESAYENSEWNSYFSSITGILTWNCGLGGSSSDIATLSDGTLTVFGSGNMENYSGATPWDSYKSSITAVVIENGVTSIGSFAFSDCSNLKSVTIPATVTAIGEAAFGGCIGLISITIPGNVTSIERYTFAGCSSLTSITIPGSVISIADRAFTGAGLTSITFTGENLTSIGEGVFFDCSSLTFITIPNSVNSIGEGVFYDCSSLTSVTLPESLTSIERVTFSNCSRLTSITIPTGVISIGEQAFYNCTGLTAVTIPANVTTIGYQAFYGCSGLTSITIPASVTSIMKAFDNCSSLTDITVEVGNTSYSSEGGVLFNDAKTVLIKYPEGKTDASYSIPNSVTGIGEHAFFACSNLTSVFIPEGMTDIGMYAFSGCSGLTSVTSLATAPPPLGLSAFNGIDPDCTLAVPAGSEDAYENSEWNSYFSSITGILTWNCGPAGSPSVIATLSDGTLTVFGSGDMEDYSGATPWDSYRTQIRTVVIEEGVTLIGNVAFSGCSNLNEVAISNSVVWIGTGAFSYCTSLYGISIPGSVTALGGDAFSGCSNLEDVEMNEGLKYINPNAFKDCSSLTSVTLPASVTSIEDYAFSGCTGLMEIENLQPAPQTINSNVFSGLTLGNLTLIVPTGTATLYEAAAVWEDFGTIVDGVFESYLQPQAGTYRIYPVTNSNSYLAADADNFLGSYNNQAPADGNATFYTEATGDGQYVLAVNHEKTAQYLRGRFLFDATDLAWTNGSGSSILDPGYLASGRTRLAFAEGIRVDNTLYVLDGEQVSDISQLESLAQEGKIRKIDLTADSRFSFGFRLVENYGSDFLLQTGRLNVNILSYVSIYNGIPVISRSDFQNALGAGTIFGMEVVAAPVPALTVSPSSLDFTVAGGSQTLDISSNATWTVTNPASWITVSATSGWSNGSITVTAAANSANASRTATVTVSINGIDRTVTVTQGTSALSVSPSSLDFTATGGSQTFDISSNVAWTVANMEPWATVSVSSGSGNGTVTVTVTPNSDYASRTATVEVSAGGISRTVDILQEGTPAPASLTVTPSSLDFATAGGSQEVDVVSNRNWTAVSDAPWLTVTQESGSVLRIAATANTGYARMDSVTVTADGLTQFVYVTQDAAQQIIAEPTPPANSQGSIQIALEIPVNEQFSITFTVTLPAGFVLDQQATSLVSGLLNSYQLSVTPNGLGGWLFEITPALSLSSLRNGEDTDYREIVNIVYTLQKGIQSGDYEVKIQDVDLTLDNGEVIHQDEINVPVRISDDVSNATVGATDVRYFNGLLYVNTPVAERITVYSLTGAAVYQSKKAEGAATFDLHSLPKGILIIRGESGWTRKVYSE